MISHSRLSRLEWEIALCKAFPVCSLQIPYEGKTCSQGPPQVPSVFGRYLVSMNIILKRIIMLTHQGWEENLPTYKFKIPIILEKYV